VPEKHVPKHRAPKRELFGRRNSVAGSNNGNGSSNRSAERRVVQSSSNGAGVDAVPPALREPDGRRDHDRAASAPKPETAGPPPNTSQDLFAPDVTAPPVLSSEDYFGALVKPKPPSPVPASAGARGAEPTESMETVAAPRITQPRHKDGGSDLLEEPKPIQVRSAIQGGSQAWDPFLKDPEPEARRFRRKEPKSDLERLKTISTKRKLSRPRPAEERQEHQSLGQWLKEIILLGLIAILTAVLLTNYVVQAFFIPSESMENTLVANDRVLVNKLVYKIRDPRPGDVIVFTSPERDAVDIPEAGVVGRVLNQAAQGLGLRSSVQDLIKRVVAVEGQVVEARIGSLYVDGQQVGEPYRKDRLPMPNYGPYEVPAGHVFVLGDNRMQSHDSRAFGPIPEDTIVGRAFALIWPIQRLSLLTS